MKCHHAIAYGILSRANTDPALRAYPVALEFRVTPNIKASFEFGNHSPCIEKAVIECRSVGNAGHLKKSITNGPSRLVHYRYSARASSIFVGNGGIVLLMRTWFYYAIGAAVLYGLHQIFTKLASERISDGLGSFVVEGAAALTILFYLAALRLGGNWNQSATPVGVWYSVLTGICVGIGTIFFFLLFQKGGPLSAVPMILAGGGALMALAGILFFKEPATLSRLLGIVLALTGLILLRAPAGN
jgi:transporter family protein